MNSKPYIEFQHGVQPCLPLRFTKAERADQRSREAVAAHRKLQVRGGTGRRTRAGRLGILAERFRRGR